MNANKDVAEEAFKDVVGHIYSEYGVYEPDTIWFTVKVKSKIEVGEIVCIEHPTKKGVPVFYQVYRVPLRRKVKSYEEDLLRLGKIIVDKTRNYPRAIAKQIGFYKDNKIGSEDNKRVLLEHIEPQAPVYRPADPVIELLLKPEENHITIGEIYPSFKHKMSLEIPKLIRQGLLVVGGVGTGKTTTMVSVVYNITKALLDEKKQPHVLVVDKDGEYCSDKLVELIGDDMYLHVHIDEITLGVQTFRDEYDFRRNLLGVLTISPNSKEGRALATAISQAARRGVSFRLDPDYVEEKLIPLIPKDYRESILKSIDAWKELMKSQEETEGAFTVEELVIELKKRTFVHVDLSKTRDWTRSFEILTQLLKYVYDEAIYDENFGAIIVLDEAHVFSPERGGIELADKSHVDALRDVIKLIATTGPRNGVTPFFATQRPALIDKTITTQLGQNIIAHRVEDVDLARLIEIMGDIAKEVTLLPRGWALIKSSASKINQPFIVKITPSDYPKSVGKTAYYRFKEKPSYELMSIK